MALRAVPEHPKFAALKAELKLSKFQALGLLEALWHFTGRFAPRGNIGKFTDRQIEAWLEWAGDPGVAVAALVESGWLTRHPDYRLLAWQWGHWSGLSKRSRRWIAIRASGGEVTRELRIRIYERDGWMCRRCKSVDDLTIDHVFPISLGGLTIEENLQTLCRRCNASKKDRVEGGA